MHQNHTIKNECMKNGIKINTTARMSVKVTATTLYVQCIGGIIDVKNYQK